MKTALVTGSTQGIGKQVGIDLLKAGYHVIFNYGHNDEGAKELEKEISLFSKNFSIIKNDFSTEENIYKFVSDVKQIINHLDVLVLNASITNKNNIEDLTFSEWNDVIMTNLTAPFFLVKSFKNLIKTNGNIIFIGTILGLFPHSISIPYGVSKAAIHMLAKSLVKEFCENKIRVNVIAPGFVDTPWQKNKAPDHRKRIEDKIALHRFATVEEISNSVHFVINNNYVNGAILQLDGAYDYK